MESERLVVRPWMDEDAPALFEIAKDPLVGPPCGWPVHQNEDESLNVIRKILKGNPDEKAFAIERKC